jgi:hypothetical protein
MPVFIVCLFNGNIVTRSKRTLCLIASYILCHYCKSFPTLSKSNGGESSFLRVRFYTRSLLCLTDIHSLFYVDKVNIIPYNIYDLLTPVAVAHWRFIYINIYKLKYIIYIFLQGDGTKHGNGLVLCTDSFTIGEVVTLINVLIIRYNLDCSVFNKGGNYRFIFVHVQSPYWELSGFAPLFSCFNAL